MDEIKVTIEETVPLTEEELAETEAQKAAKLAEEKAKERRKNTMREIFEWVKDLTAAFVVVFIVLQFLMPTIVHQNSMENTLMEHDYLILSKKAYTWFGEPEKGDIIVFESNITWTNGKNQLLVKRVIATGGDTIAIESGDVYVNGEVLDEPYLKDGWTNGSLEETVVPEGYLFCMGDNRLVSMDSRDSRIGFVSEDCVCGKVILRLYPFNKIGGLYNDAE